MPGKKKTEIHVRPTKGFTFHSSNTRGIRKKAAGAGADGLPSGLAGTATSVAQAPLYYDYRYSTPDKFWFPRQRNVANSIWREIYKRDAVVAIATDMYAELPWSDFELQGISDTTIKHVYEDMFSDLNLVPKFGNYTRDFLITGELILHTIFNNKKGYWDRSISHNPDYVRVQGVAIALEEPLLYLRPTPEVKAILTSSDPRARALLKFIPQEIVNAYRAGREVPLDSLNTTYIPRLISSQDVRGTSIYTRLYRVIMYEDFVVNASLAIAQRHAAPLRIFKLGNMSGEAKWMPTDDDITSFSDMLSQAESDPLSAIITHMDVSTELVGVSDKVLLISREWDYTERVKLLALGVSKAFLMGEASFASAVAGLQTLMERLHALRMRIEHDWIIKKLCLPVAEINRFYKRTKAELDHRIRVKKDDEHNLIIPHIKWKKDLSPAQDQGLLSVWRDLKERNIISDRTYASGAGVNLDVERRNISEEVKFKQQNPELYPVAAPEVGGGGGGISGGPSLGPSALPEELEKSTDTTLDKVTEEPGNVKLEDVVSAIKQSPYVEQDIVDELDKAIAYFNLNKGNKTDLLTGVTSGKR